VEREVTAAPAVLRDNRASLVRATVAGRIAPTRIFAEAPAVDREGRHISPPPTGGIALGVHMGDSAGAWLADHLMPGASIEDADEAPAVAGPLHLLSSVGNVVRDGGGRRIGVVAGKRGGMAPGFWAPQLVSVEIADGVAASLVPGDRVVVETEGRGLRLLDHPAIELMNVSPALLGALPLIPDGANVVCEVSGIVPPEAAGPGLGQDSWIGDLEIAADNLLVGDADQLRFGDLVAFRSIDASVTRFYRPGWISVGLVSHGPSPTPGHGIGVTLLLTGPETHLEVKVGPKGAVGLAIRQWAEAMEGA
jgi:hypothetical protein